MRGSLTHRSVSVPQSLQSRASQKAAAPRALHVLDNRPVNTQREVWRTISVLLIAAELTCLCAWAQSSSASAQRFEVASIKPCQESDSPGGGEPSPGRLNLVCVTTANLIRLAYIVYPAGEANTPISPGAFQMPISLGPRWLDSDRYRIDAKLSGPTNVEMMKGPMMQALLEERFKLKLHREARQVNGFELTLAKGGTRLHLAKAGACIVFDRNSPMPDRPPEEHRPVLCGSLWSNASGGFDIPGVTMADLCRQLSSFIDRDIVDNTGLKDVYDVHLELAPADLGYPDAAPDPLSPFTPGDGGAISLAIQKLGLRMRTVKGSAQFIVIDHIERPSEN